MFEQPRLLYTCRYDNPYYPALAKSLYMTYVPAPLRWRPYRGMLVLGRSQPSGMIFALSALCKSCDPFRTEKLDFHTRAPVKLVRSSYDEPSFLPYYFVFFNPGETLRWYLLFGEMIFFLVKSNRRNIF